ncbi:hypothetical protein V6N13_041810 [Hibiscus sabdariffa]
MIGRADIEGSKSNVAMNAWLATSQLSCGNFSDTSSFKFRRSKGSIGHAFTVRNSTPALSLTDVPPQPNSPPDNVFRPDRPAEADLGSKKEGLCPASDSRNNRIPLSVPVLSRLFVARGRPPKEPFPVRPPAGTRRPALAAGAARAGAPAARRVRDWDPRRASPQSQSFSRGYGSILPTSLAYIVPSTRGCSPWRPDAVMSTTGRGRHSVLRIFKGRRGRTGHHATCGALPAAGPYLRLSPFPGSAPTAAPPGLTPRVLRRPPRPPTHRGLALAPTAGTPWSVFQDGPDGEPAGPTPGARWCRSTPRRRVLGSTIEATTSSTGVSKARAWAATTIRVGPRPEPIRRTGSRRSTSDRGASPAPIRFPPDNFKHSLTLFSKSFSSFPRGTCSLSVSRPYLALDGIYRPIRAAFPNNPTRRQRLVVRQGPGTTGLSPSPAPLSRGLGPGPSLRTLLQTTIRTPEGDRFSAGLFPVRSPLLRESL